MPTRPVPATPFPLPTFAELCQHQVADRRNCLRLGLGLSAVGIAGSMLGGCSTPPAAPKPVIRNTPLLVESGKDSNPDARNRASPIVVRLYELESASTFMASDFLSLYDRDQATLGTTFLAREEWSLIPGQRLNQTRIWNTRTRVIGAIAAFRDLERSVWRAATDVASIGPGGLQILIAGRTLRLEPR